MTADILALLAAPFAPEIVSWRVGSQTHDKTKGMALAYIDARDVQDRLNEACGLNWQVRNPWSVAGKLACEIGIKVDGEWLWRGDGAGDTDVEAEKGAFSDAFKRAAVRWGIGRYLYDIDSPWVQLTQKGRSYVIADSEYPKLRAALARKAPPRGVERPSGAGPSPPTPPPSPRPAPAAVAGPRDEAFFRGKSYEIPPKAAGGTVKLWREAVDNALRGMRNIDELAKFENDNRGHVANYTEKAKVEDVNSLLALLKATEERLKRIATAA